MADGVYVRVDALVRVNDDFTLIETKSSSSVKDEHIADAAVQAWVLGQSEVPIHRVEIMHLNKDYRHPDQGDLFARSDITEPVATFLPQVPAKLAEFASVLEGDLPEMKVGAHCFRPRDCPFMNALLAGRSEPHLDALQHRAKEDGRVHGERGAFDLGSAGGSKAAGR